MTTDGSRPPDRPRMHLAAFLNAGPQGTVGWRHPTPTAGSSPPPSTPASPGFWKTRASTWPSCPTRWPCPGAWATPSIRPSPGAPVHRAWIRSP
ncbi:hypothetical protein NKH77_51650 [Streptomyces sp. M19]